MSIEQIRTELCALQPADWVIRGRDMLQESGRSREERGLLWHFVAVGYRMLAVPEPQRAIAAADEGLGESVPEPYRSVLLEIKARAYCDLGEYGRLAGVVNLAGVEHDDQSIRGHFYAFKGLVEGVSGSPEALTWLSQAEEILTNRGNAGAPWTVAWVQRTGAAFCLEHDRPEEAIRWASRITYPQSLAWGVLLQAHGMVRLGAVDEPSAMVDRVFADHTVDDEVRGYAHCVRAELALRQGEVYRANCALHSAAQAVSRMGRQPLHVLNTIADLRARLGREGVA